MPFYSPAWLKAHPELKSTHLSLGWHPKSRDELLIPDDDRYAGMYVLGVPGMGKSGLLETLIYQDALAGKAIVVVDPHGDLVDHALAFMPQHLLAKTFVLDMEDEEHPYGINPFETFKTEMEVERSMASAKVEHLFEVLWAGSLDQQFLPRFVRAVTFTLLDNPGLTLVDVLTLLTDDDFRAKMVRNVKAADVRRFWRDEYDNRGEAMRTQRVGPLIGRLESLFMGRALVTNIVGQRKTSINFRRVIEERQIILVKLPIKKLGNDARLVGLLLIAQIHAAIFSYADVPQAQRPGLSLYIDEFQNFTTSDIEELITEGRKYGIRLTIAHQIRSKLPEFLKEPTIASRTKVVMQTTDKDAREMAPFFPIGGESIRPEDLDTHPTKYLIEHGGEGLVGTFVSTYLRPLQHDKRGGHVEIESTKDIGVLDMVIPGSLSKDGKKDAVVVHDPTPYLDHLFYETMRTHNPLLPIPWQAVAGLANCGIGFWGAVRNPINQWYYGPEATFPEHLANRTAQGFVWLRPPESGKEQFLHCLFHLRATMRYLAEHPIGKTSKASTSDSAQMLLQLPARTAFVRYGKDVGVIYTHRKPNQLEGAALEARKILVRDQTRATYCHPREQVEHLIDETTPPDMKTLSRWEEVTTDDTPSLPGETNLRHSLAGYVLHASGVVPTPPVNGGTTDTPPLQSGVAQKYQGTYEGALGAWVRSKRHDSEH